MRWLRSGRRFLACGGRSDERAFQRHLSLARVGADHARRLPAEDQDAGLPLGTDEQERRAWIEQMRREWGGTLASPRARLAWSGTDNSRSGGAGCSEWAQSPAAVMALVAMNDEIDIRHILPAIRVPTLLLHSVRDATIPIGASRYMAERIPGARLVELPGEDHLPWLTDSEAILGEIEEFLTGVRHAVEPDRVLATVLFTDIVGSTEKAAALGDRRWRDLLDQHHALIRTDLARFRGREVKTTGDGILATFDGPARGVRCACAIAEEVRPLGIEVRAGLHTGECEMMGDDVGGIAVHIGARVAALTGAGEVLVSSTVKDLVAGSGLRFGDRGSQSLKGVPGEWHIYAVER